ncbi:phage terminase small subunit P27 family [Carnobacteriaceae bacterium zg-ZUI252]|nr:phage terminase small subunit P27 family [Carnobacteriaceae bacterium zg-ZUI252]
MARPAKPISLTVLHNNKRHLSNKEIDARTKAEESLKIAKNALKAPVWLGKIAKKEFNFIVKQTESIELLNNLDVHVLAIYCNTYEEYVKVSQRIAKDGPIVAANKASETVEASHPLYVKQYQLLQSLKMLMTELGLSPSARTKLALHNAKKDMAEEKGEFDSL